VEASGKMPTLPSLKSDPIPATTHFRVCAGRCLMQHAFLSDADDCLEQPCLNEGTCIDELNGYSCLCKEGYKGVNCEDGKNSNAQVFLC